MNGSGVPERTPVRIVGLVAGQSLDAMAQVQLTDTAVVLRWVQGAPWEVALDHLDGVAISADADTPRLTLYFSGGDLLELSGDRGVRLLGAQLMDRACTLPELTRGLTALGSPRGRSRAAAEQPVAPEAAQDAWFAPFLSARRAAHGVRDPLRQLTLLDAQRLADGVADVIAELAVIRAPGGSAEAQATRRAIEAMLEEAAEPVFAALDRMGLAADALQGSASDTRLLDWRRWVETLQAAFVALDAAWEPAARVIAAA
ncbi:MAG: hypothetical protein WCK74_06870 [Gemmatimonadaceae bacterium]